ncbi:MAG: bestrophin family ion channel [Ginsengibacter sp.]
MITHNPRTWFKFMLTFHKEDTFRKLLPMILAISAYSFAVACFAFLWWKDDDNTYVKNLSLLHNLLGFVLSLLLVFRTNSAYDRWWEGSIRWNELVNTSRNLAMKINAILPEDDYLNRQFFLQTIPLFSFKLRNHLRDSADFTPINFSDPHPAITDYENKRNDPLKILSIMYKRIYGLQEEGLMNGEQLLSAYLDVEKLNDVFGACERIKNTPIPSSYSIFVKKFVYIYLMTLPFGFIFSLGFYVVPVVAFTYYVLASLEMIAEEIEDPFGDDANDIPTNNIVIVIKHNAETILHTERKNGTGLFKLNKELMVI